MFSELILKTTNCVYWDFLSTLSAMLLGIFFTWLFSKYYYGKASRYLKKLSAIYIKELSNLSGRKIEIEHDEKGMPIRVVFISMSGSLNLKGELEAVEIKATNKDN